jgi:hypothetical protein
MYVDLVTDILNSERCLNYLRNTSFPKSHIAQSMSLTKAKVEVTFKEKQ